MIKWVKCDGTEIEKCLTVEFRGECYKLQDTIYYGSNAEWVDVCIAEGWE